MDIRRILNVLDNQINESRGLGARKRGEVFKSTDGDSEIYFRVVRFWPEGGGAYDNQVEMQQAIEEIASSMGDVKIQWTNKLTSRERAFGIALFDTPEGNILAFGKYFSSVRANPVENTWENKHGIPGYSYASNAAQKSSAGMMPQDVLSKESMNNLSTHDIVEQIEHKFGPDHPLSEVARKVAAGENYPITVDAPEESFTAFRDYFCELLHPIALVTGMYSGNAGEAAAKFLGPNGFADCDISFGDSKTGGLSDSIMSNSQGKTIKVSSKGARGATASVKNLTNEIHALSENGSDLIKRHKKVVDMIEKIQKAGQAQAPLVLGVDLNLIEPGDIDLVKSFQNMPLASMDKLLANPRMSSKLKKLVKNRTANDTENLSYYYHCIAAVAHAVAEAVNSDDAFSKAAMEILNNGALIQIYTRARQAQGKWILEGFDSVYPSKTVTAVRLSATKTYYSTGIKGHFTFEILQNNAKSSDQSLEQSSRSESQTEKKKKSEPVRSSGAKAAMAKMMGSSADVGRQER